MSNLLSSLPKTIHASLALAILLFLALFYLNGGFAFDTLFWSWLTRLVHVTVAIMWIGLLWYFNFVQIPNMGKIPDEQKPAIGKVIASCKYPFNKARIKPDNIVIAAAHLK